MNHEKNPCCRNYFFLIRDSCRSTGIWNWRKKREGHHINLFYSEEDAGYVADIPDLKHCSAFGSTPEEALREVLKAKDSWIEAARSEGKPVPTPRYRPAIYQIA